MHEEEEFRLTAPLKLTLEELAYLSTDLRPKANADEKTRRIIRRINDSARIGQAELRGSSGWITRDHQGTEIFDIISDIWLRSARQGEFQFAQLFNRKGFIVRAFRSRAWEEVVRLNDFICEINGHAPDSAQAFADSLRLNEKIGLRLGLFRDSEFMEVVVPIDSQ